MSLRLLPLALLAALLGCPPPAGEDTQDSEPVDTGEMEPLEPLFSFAVLADPHLYGSADNDARAEAAVAWVNEHAGERGIELVILVGDIAWNTGTETAPGLFAELAVPWVPVTGDNEIQSSDEEAFYLAFEPQWQALGGELDSFAYAPMPVDNPEHDAQSWFTNLVFQHRGVTFIGLDWCSRTIGGVFGEMADLHDFDGATFDWWLAALEGVDETTRDSVVMFSHHPMHLSPAAFDLAEMETLETASTASWPQIHASLAGHYHMDGDEVLDSGAWEVFVTDATWDDENRLRVVDVSSNGRLFAYEHELVAVE